MNLFGFIPLGLMCAALLFVQLGRAMALVAGASLAIEAVQYFIPARVPSLADLLLNIAGGGDRHRGVHNPSCLSVTLRPRGYMFSICSL